MGKNLYFKLSDNGDLCGLIMELSGCMEYIQNDQENYSDEELLEVQYTLDPIFLTEEEFHNLPEYQF